MRQSIKQKMLTSPEQQLLHGSYTDRLSQSAALQDVELSAEFASAEEKLKSIPKKTYR